MEGTQDMSMPAQGKNGPVVGIIVVIIVLAIGAYYLFAELQSQKAVREQDPTMMQDAQMTDEQAVTDIEGDLQAADPSSSLDADTNADLNALQAQ